MNKPLAAGANPERFSERALRHRGGWALVRATWASWLQHRGFFFLLAFLWMIPALVSLFLWSAAAGTGEIGGRTRAEFVGYYLVLILVNQLTYSQANWTVGDVVRYGGLTPWLLRPIPPLYNMLASEVAGKVVYLAFSVPAALVLAAFLRPQIETSLAGGLLFLPALLLAWALRYAWGLWLAELAFWATRADGLLVVQDALVFLFAGVVAPVALLPEGMARVAQFLPFRYMVGFPVELLTGSLSQGEILTGLAVQLGWLVVAVGLARLLWLRGVRHYAAVGG